MDMEMTQLDVKTAFLNGDLIEETIWNNPPDLPCRIGRVKSAASTKHCMV
jgi:hypothetical protein